VSLAAHSQLPAGAVSMPTRSGRSRNVRPVAGTAGVTSVVIAQPDLWADTGTTLIELLASGPDSAEKQTYMRKTTSWIRPSRTR
jgi:hypothetical protein